MKVLTVTMHCTLIQVAWWGSMPRYVRHCTLKSGGPHYIGFLPEIGKTRLVWVYLIHRVNAHLTRSGEYWNKWARAPLACFSSLGDFRIILLIFNLKLLIICIEVVSQKTQQLLLYMSIPAELQLLHAPCTSMHTTARLSHASSPCTSARHHRKWWQGRKVSDIWGFKLYWWDSINIIPVAIWIWPKFMQHHAFVLVTSQDYYKNNKSY